MQGIETTNCKYQAIYEPLVKSFIEEVNGLSLDRIPKPFLPIYGESYPSSARKVAIAGIETNGWGDLKDFVTGNGSDFKASDNQWSAYDFSDVLYGKNGSLRTFWDFVTGFLAGYYACDQSQILDLENHSYMQSFVWANCNSIEDINTINKNLDPSKPRVDHHDWSSVKKASERFDHGKNIIEVFSPDVFLIMWWSPDESYLTGLMGPIKMRKIIADYVLYIEFEEVDTRVIWTAHPSYLRRLGIEESIVRLCVDLATNGCKTS